MVVVGLGWSKKEQISEIYVTIFTGHCDVSYTTMGFNIYTNHDL